MYTVNGFYVGYILLGLDRGIPILFSRKLLHRHGTQVFLRAITKCIYVLNVL